MADRPYSLALKLKKLPFVCLSRALRMMNTHELYFLSMISPCFVPFIANLNIPAEISIQFEHDRTLIQVSINGKFVVFTADETFSDGYQISLRRHNTTGFLWRGAEPNELLTTIAKEKLFTQLFSIFPKADIKLLTFQLGRNWATKREEREHIQRIADSLKTMLVLKNTIECREILLISSSSHRILKPDQLLWNTLLQKINVTNHFETQCLTHVNYFKCKKFPLKVVMQSEKVLSEDFEHFKYDGVKSVKISKVKMNEFMLGCLLVQFVTYYDPPVKSIHFCLERKCDPTRVLFYIRLAVMESIPDQTNIVRIVRRVDGVKLKVVIGENDLFVDVLDNN